MIKLNGHIVTPTIFPDGTSQVWKVTEEALKKQDHTIDWEFENEGELIQVLQLATLVYKNYSLSKLPELRIPFLPYGRQDKTIGNNSTFALTVFLEVLANSELFSSIKTVDVHNPTSLKAYNIHNELSLVNYKIQDIIKEIKPNLICFPDAGASARGYNTQGITSFNLEKKRNQDTGEIEGLKTGLPLDLAGLNILILDDICDGGRTFIEAAKLLYNMGASEVHLYTSHGLYSKGVEVLKEANIKRIFNYKGEV